MQHANALPAEEFNTLQTNLVKMVEDLDAACHQSVDPPDLAHLPVITLGHTGRRGRPSKLIDRTFLQYALGVRGPAKIARLLDCCPRTVRRQAIRLGLVQPRPPVFQRVVQPDGSVTRQRAPLAPPPASLSDDELDHAVRHILTVFPDFGRTMIAGHLAAHGHRVSDARIRLSYVRVRGAPPSFGRRRIVRKRYQVPGPNSLWHHDGQHGAFIMRLMVI